jgi:hypothetical protein
MIKHALLCLALLLTGVPLLDVVHFLRGDYAMIAPCLALRYHLFGIDALACLAPRWGRELIFFTSLVILPEYMSRLFQVDADLYALPMAVLSGRVPLHVALALESVDVWPAAFALLGMSALAALAALVPWPRGLLYWACSRYWAREQPPRWLGMLALVLSFTVTLS